MKKSFEQKNRPVAQHHGIFRYKISEFEAISLIVTSTIGAGVLGVPYAIAQIGLGLGMLYIIGIGLLMIGMNLLIGEIVVRTKARLHLPGLAKKYLGRVGQILMAIILYSMLFGVLTVYIIGEGETLYALFGGDKDIWSMLFFLLGSLIIILGLRTAKKAEFILGIGILFVVLVIAAFSSIHIQLNNLQHLDLADLLLPYGVLLFAYHGATGLPEAHSLLDHQNASFKRSIFLAGCITMFVYALFTFVVVGVTGIYTTEIATIGLGEIIGPSMLIFGNIFAILAMGTSYIMAGLALRDSMKWDFGMHHGLATGLTCIVPFLVYFFGIRSFVALIDVIGGVFISLEMLLLLLMYWKAKQLGDLPVGKYKLHHVLPLIGLLLVALAIGVVYSVGKWF